MVFPISEVLDCPAFWLSIDRAIAPNTGRIFSFRGAWFEDARSSSGDYRRNLD